MKILIDVWGGDCHQNLVESRDFENDEWPIALEMVRERVEAGCLCNVLHLDFQASEEISKGMAAKLLAGEK